MYWFWSWRLWIAVRLVNITYYSNDCFYCEQTLNCGLTSYKEGMSPATQRQMLSQGPVIAHRPRRGYKTGEQSQFLWSPHCVPIGPEVTWCYLSVDLHITSVEPPNVAFQHPNPCFHYVWSQQKVIGRFSVKIYVIQYINKINNKTVRVKAWDRNRGRDRDLWCAVNFNIISVSHYAVQRYSTRRNFTASVIGLYGV